MDNNTKNSGVIIMKCSFCGAELEPGSGFCPECGTLIGLDNNFERPKETEKKVENVSENSKENNDVYSEPITVRESPYKAYDEIGGVPEYVSPVFEDSMTSNGEKIETEEAEEDPFAEMHPDLEPEEEESDALDDMYIGSSKKKKGGIVIAVLAVILIAVVVGGAYAVKSNYFKPEVSDSEEDTRYTVSVVQPTEETDTSESEEETSDEEDSTADTSESETEESTSESAAATETTEEKTTEEKTTETSTSAAPVVTEPSTTKPAETTKPATTKPVTTKPATTKPATTKPATTKPVTTKPVTTKPATTKPATTKPSTTKPSATTLQKPKKTFDKYTAYATTDGVLLRYAPDSSSAKRVSLSIGNDVVVSGEENGFYYVYSNRYQISGWASKAYISKNRPVAKTETKVSGLVNPDKTYSNPKTKTVSISDGLRLRKGPGTDYDVIRDLGKGYPVAVKGESTSAPGWVYVTDITRGISGWVMGSYLN